MVILNPIELKNHLSQDPSLVFHGGGPTPNTATLGLRALGCEVWKQTDRCAVHNSHQTSLHAGPHQVWQRPILLICFMECILVFSAHVVRTGPNCFPGKSQACVSCQISELLWYSHYFSLKQAESGPPRAPPKKCAAKEGVRSAVCRGFASQMTCQHGYPETALPCICCVFFFPSLFPGKVLELSSDFLSFRWERKIEE